MKMNVASVVVAGWLALLLPSVQAQDDSPTEPTAEQVKAARDGFASQGGKYEYVLDPRTNRGTHTFTLPQGSRDDRLQKLPDVPFPFALNLQQTNLTEAGIRELKKFKTLVRLNLAYSPVTAALLHELAELPALQELDLTAVKVPGRGFVGALEEAEMKELARLKRLTTLRLGYVRLTAEGVRQLKAAPALTTLSLSAGRGPFFPGNDPGVLRALRELKSVRHLWTGDPSAEALRELKDMKQLRTLSLTWESPLARRGLKELRELDPNIAIEMKLFFATDADLKELRGLRNLTLLNLTGTQVTDKGMQELAELKSLTALYLGGTKVTDAGMRHLRGLKSLTSFCSSAHLTTAALADLKELTNLTALHVYIRDLSEQGMQELAGLKKLRYVQMNLPAGCAKQLKQFPALSVVVGTVGLTDQSLRDLQQLPALRYVNVCFCAGLVTDQGIAAFRQARPECLITRERPDELGFEEDGR